jgi:hypothetical protein
VKGNRAQGLTRAEAFTFKSLRNYQDFKNFYHDESKVRRHGQKKFYHLTNNTNPGPKPREYQRDSDKIRAIYVKVRRVRVKPGKFSGNNPENQSAIGPVRVVRGFFSLSPEAVPKLQFWNSNL